MKLPFDLRSTILTLNSEAQFTDVDSVIRKDNLLRTAFNVLCMQTKVDPNLGKSGALWSAKWMADEVRELRTHAVNQHNLLWNVLTERWEDAMMILADIECVSGRYTPNSIQVGNLETSSWPAHERIAAASYLLVDVDSAAPDLVMARPLEWVQSLKART